MKMPEFRKKICKKTGFTPHQFHLSFVSFLCNEAKRLRLPAFVKKNCTSGIGEGFTLVELLVTIFLVSVGLVGVLSFFNSSLQSNFEAKNELIAAGLTQEGTELVRNIVDYNYSNPGIRSNWWEEIATNSNGNSNCNTIDYNSLSDHECIIPASGKKKAVYFDGTRYRQASAPESGNTIFTREIVIEGKNVIGPGPPPATNIDLDAGDCLSVTATVTWNDRTTTATDIICKPRQ